MTPETIDRIRVLLKEFDAEDIANELAELIGLPPVIPPTVLDLIALPDSPVHLGLRAIWSVAMVDGMGRTPTQVSHPSGIQWNGITYEWPIGPDAISPDWRIMRSRSLEGGKHAVKCTGPNDTIVNPGTINRIAAVVDHFVIARDLKL